MTADSTVPSPGAQPWDHGSSPVSVRPARPAGSFRFPARRRPARSTSPLPLLVADLLAALAGAVTLDEASRRLSLVVALVLGAIVLRPRSSRALPGVLDELPVVCGRIAVAWLSVAALLAAYDPAAH